MNRRDFLRRGSVGGIAVAASVAVPTIIESKETVDFPTTEVEMRDIIKNTKNVKYRGEGMVLPEGLCSTNSWLSTFWYFHKGDRVAILHERPSDNHVCFLVERYEPPKPTYYPPDRVFIR